MFSRNALSKTAALCAAVATFATTAPAAVALHDTATMEVRFGDLDLSTPRDRARLDSRLRGAARAVCAGTARTGTRINSGRARCHSEALAEARNAIAPRIAAAEARTRAAGD